MKKNFIVWVGIAVMAMSCSKTEFLAAPETSVIKFENAFVDKLTKADITSSSLTSFKVYGIGSNNETIFDGDEVSRMSGSWQYENTQRWNSNDTYAFAAYAPVEASDAISNIAHDWNGNKFTFDYNSDEEHQHDLVLACNMSSENQGAVELDFKHLMSIVYLVFKSEDSDYITFNVNSLELSGINTTAHYNGMYFEDLSKAGTYNMLSDGGAEFKQSKDLVSKAIYVIPQQLNEGAAVMSLNLNAIDDFGNTLTYNDKLEIALPDINWEAGKTYVITTDMNVNDVNPAIQLSKIEFTIDGVAGWENGGSVNITQEI